MVAASSCDRMPNRFQVAGRIHSTLSIRKMKTWSSAARAANTMAMTRKTRLMSVSVARMGVESVSTQCCIAGGGPAGMMLGLLLARAGVDVIVLEKHADFFRDFRGDTIHPSTLDLIDQLGLRASFDAIPHNELARLAMVLNG